MGFPDLRREALRARNGYLGAVRRWHQAGDVFEAAAIPLLPESDGPFTAWTNEQVAVMSACAEAWASLLAARRGYDAAQKDLRVNDPQAR